VVKPHQVSRVELLDALEILLDPGQVAILGAEKSCSHNQGLRTEYHKARSESLVLLFSNNSLFYTLIKVCGNEK